MTLAPPTSLPPDREPSLLQGARAPERKNGCTSAQGGTEIVTRCELGPHTWQAQLGLVL